MNHSEPCVEEQELIKRTDQLKKETAKARSYLAQAVNAVDALIRDLQSRRNLANNGH